MKGMALLKGNEGCNLNAYWDGLGKCWTIGWGHTGPDVHPGLMWGQDHADWVLLNDASWAVDAVNNMVTAPISQPMFDALVDFTFQEGSHALETSTLLSKLNRCDYTGASAEFPKWDLAKGQLSPGILQRRMRDKAMFDGGIDEIVAA